MHLSFLLQRKSSDSQLPKKNSQRRQQIAPLHLPLFHYLNLSRPHRCKPRHLPYHRPHQNQSPPQNWRRSHRLQRARLRISHLFHQGLQGIPVGRHHRFPEELLLGPVPPPSLLLPPPPMTRNLPGERAKELMLKHPLRSLTRSPRQLKVSLRSTALLLRRTNTKRELRLTAIRWRTQFRPFANRTKPTIVLRARKKRLDLSPPRRISHLPGRQIPFRLKDISALARHQ